MKTPESRVLSSCLHYLQARRIFHWRNNTGAVQIAPGRFMRFGRKGSSDILGVLPGGRFLAVECKAKGGRLSPEQKKYIDEINEAGALALCVRGWEELDQELRAAGYAADDMMLFEEAN